MRWALVIALVIAVPAVAIADDTLDSDTLKQERARFPDALELITGKFLRHSKDFDRWEIADRTAKLAKAPSDPALLDDLAIAYAKIGDTGQAIATMKRADPARYDTEANLGAFHVMAGDFDGGLADLDRALAMDPDAHAGRERHEKWLVEYVKRRLVDGVLVLPLRFAKAPPTSFYDDDMAEAHASTPAEKSAERSRAVTALLALMRFGDYQSPILLEALGDLLAAGGGPDHLDDAKQLAARAYLQAAGGIDRRPAPGVDAQRGKAAYRDLAKRVLEHQVVENTDDQEPFEQAEAELGSEMYETNEWYEALRAHELEWIKSGANPEVEFAKLYPTEPAVVATMNAHDAKIPRWHWIIYGGLFGLSMLVMWRIARRFRR